jgi:hypothetical protein
MADEVKSMLGIMEPGDEEKLSPEEQQALAQRRQQAQQQAQRAQMAQELALAEQGAKVKKLTAEANKVGAEAGKIGAEAQNLLSGADSAATAEHQRQLAEVERAGAEAVEAATAKINELLQKLANRQYEIDKKAETDQAVAEINAGAKVEGERVATEAKAAEDAILRKVEDYIRGLEDKLKEITAQMKARTEVAGEGGEKQMPTVVFEAGAIVIDAKSAPVAKTVTAKTGSGKPLTMRIEPDKPKGEK